MKMNNLTRIKEIAQFKEYIDLGLDADFLAHMKNRMYILDEKVNSYIKIRSRQSHKGTYGHALILAGSYGKMGAAVLSAKACLRSGVGLLTMAVPHCGYEILQISVPEAICLADENQKILFQFPEIKAYGAIGIGPGIGCDNLTAYLLKQLLINANQPLVLDADAINIISKHKELLDLLPENTVLTPHIKEFERLVGPITTVEDRFIKVQEFSVRMKCIVVLKDAYTCVCSSKGDFFFNTSGNQGMATGGSGDVLTGIITGLLAQNYEPLSAALIGVFKHGVAGDIAAINKGYNAMIASDIIDSLWID